MSSYYERLETERRAPSPNFNRVEDGKRILLCNYTDRGESCFGCGVPHGQHKTSEFACKRWRGRP